MASIVCRTDNTRGYLVMLYIGIGQEEHVAETHHCATLENAALRIMTVAAYQHPSNLILARDVMNRLIRRNMRRAAQPV